MDLAKLLKKDLICFLQASNKNDAISELLKILKVKNIIDDYEKTKEAVFAREKLMSTGIGLEIGVPHVRMDGIKKPVIIMGISRNGIADYNSLDGKLVKIIIMVLVAKGAHREYIKILAEIATKMKDEEIRRRIIHSQDKENIISCF